MLDASEGGDREVSAVWFESNRSFSKEDGMPWSGVVNKQYGNIFN